ncbi:MAG: DUF1592 domain-containing protein [Nannocystis sp.]|nr:DUF1592 domain-containing protein [Nannocystis sp.]
MYAACLACSGPAGSESNTDASTSAGTALISSTTDGDDSDDPTAGSSSDTGDEPAFVPAPGGLRRLMIHQYVESVRFLLGDAAATAAAPPEDHSLYGFDAIGAAELSLPDADVELIETSARAIAIAALAEPTPLSEHVPCVLQADPASGCYTSLARDFGRLAWRRTLSDGEVAQLVAIAEQARAWDGEFTTGLQYELMALLQSPYFLYIVEVGEPSADDPARHDLTNTELAARMSFFLLGRTPDAALLDAAEDGGLATKAQAEAAARAMLARPEARTTLAAFYSELLLLRDVPGVLKNPELFPQFNPALAEAMVKETLLLIDDVVWKTDSDIHALFNADYTFVNTSLAALYGVQGPPGPGFIETTLPAEQGRAGLLGHASFLARFAHPAETSPTRRGLFLRTRILCESVPPPPPGVDTSLPPEDPDKVQTMKERLTVHMEDPKCNSCHSLMDPIGLALENFDAIGAFRTLDSGLPIDASGTIADLGDFDGPRALADLIASDERTAACVIKNFVRGTLGHLERSGERPVLDDLNEGFADDGYRLQELLVQLAASPIFRSVGDPK